MSRRKVFAVNADYVPQQLSFLKDGGELINPTCIVSPVVLCHICQLPIPRFSRTYYYIARGKPLRICKLCYKSYKQTFDVKLVRKLRKGGK